MNEVNSIEITLPNQGFIKTWQLYLILSTLSIIILMAYQKFVMTQEVYYLIYGNQMEEYRIDDLIKFLEKLQVWSYFATPLFIWLRLAFVAFLIQLPFLLKGIELSFNEIFRITVFAFFVLLFADVFRFFYLFFLPKEMFTTDSLMITPLSITNFLNKSNYSTIAYEFLTKINVFEFFWSLVVCRGLYQTGKVKKIDSILVVISVWTGILIMQTMLNLSLSIL